jgi:mono/diheme cytochrome c family protein
MFLVLGLALCAAQTTKVKTTSSLTTAISGKALYGQYCAACHGADGKGGGPAATALVKHPTDLTQLRRFNAGEFPEEHFVKMMNGEVPVSAHGSANMPIWGDYFRNTTNNPNLVQDRIHSLLNYMEDIQGK